MDDANIEFGRSLLSKTETHEDWLAVMKFGLTTFIKNPEILIDIIVGEADRLHRNDSETDYFKQVAMIIQELGIKFTI